MPNAYYDIERQRRLSRLHAEAIQLAQRYGAVGYDTQNGTWLYIERFPLDPGWNKTHVALLLDVPHGTPGYPQIPPAWFWMDIDLRTREGKSIHHFFVSASTHADLKHLEKGWGHFCVHVKTWKPAPGQNLLQGDSFLTYVELIRVILYDRRTRSQHL